MHRRLYAFVRRLTRISDVARTHRCILQAIAKEVGAQTAAFATYSEAEQALVITATHGYPSAIVEHVRIQPGEGVIGQAFVSSRAAIVLQDEAARRLRYRTNSFMVVPLVASGQCLAVLTLTDRADGQAFDSRDLASARLLAAPAALALARHRVSESLDELTRAATVDPVTGLFNRRYFETQIQAEVQRARRQQQDLALLMVDIDDFKRINDTLGHLEGDRALARRRQPAAARRAHLRPLRPLRRRRVRDRHARGDAAGGRSSRGAHQAGHSGTIAAERAPMTVSVGVGFLGPDQTEEELIDAADRALMAAKRAGKNVVKTS